MSELPKNLEAERALIGSVLASSKLEGLAEQVLVDDFNNLQHQAIWNAILRLHARGDPLDIITVCAALEGSKHISEIEAATLITRMIGEVPSTMHVEKYAELVQVTAAKRKLAVVLPKISRIAYSDDKHDPFSVFADAQAIIEKAGADIQPVEREQWTAAELVLLEIPDNPFYLDGLIIEGGLNLLAGEYASGKTFLCIELAIGTSTSAGAWGRTIKPGNVLYLGCDNMRETLIRRLRELCKGREVEAPHESLVIDISPLDLGTPAGIATVRSLVIKHNAQLVIIDAMARYLGRLDENSAGDVGSLMAELREIIRMTGCTMVLVHHLRKIGTQMTRSKIADRVRGSGDFIGAVDSAIIVTTKGEGPNVIRQITHVKNRESIESHPLAFSIQTGEEGGLVIPFEAGSEMIASDTLVETAATIMANTMQRTPGVTYLKADLQDIVASTGIDLKSRTASKAFSMLGAMPMIAVKKQGRLNVYSWVGTT